MAMEKTVRGGGSSRSKVRLQAASPGMQPADVIATSRPPARRQHGEGGTEVAQIRLMADALDPGACRERRVHQHHGGMQAGQIVADGLGVVAGDRRVREQSSTQPGANGGDLVQVQGLPRSRAIAVLAEGALGHDGEHAGTRRGLEHDVAGPDGGGLQRGVGERQGGGELLQSKLFLRCAPGMARSVMTGAVNRKAKADREVT